MLRPDLAVPLTPNGVLDALFEQVSGGGLVLAGAFGLAAGVVLGLSPVALPALPAAATVLSPAVRSTEGSRRPLLRSAPTVAAFVVGMDVPLAVAGYSLSVVQVALARTSVVLGAVSAVLLAAAGLYMVVVRPDVCSPRRPLPAHPADALAYGVVFSVTGCAACGPLLVGLGSAVALVATPLGAVLALVLFVTGRTAVLLAAVALGGRLLARPGGSRSFAAVVGVALLVAAGYYAYLLATGRISSVLPGERGATLLP